VTALWCSSHIERDHDLVEFDCGVRDLDVWLRSMAFRADRQDTARTYVWTTPGSAVVWAYYSIAPTTVQRAGVPRSASGGHTAIPSYLLAKLALDRSLHGRGLGTELLLDALQRIAAAVTVSGGRLVVVDPVDQAARGFYLHHGFTAITGSERLFVRAASLNAVFARNA
jgi:GNAT superfamily N-acetyltransferase